MVRLYGFRFRRQMHHLSNTRSNTLMWLIFAIEFSLIRLHREWGSQTATRTKKYDRRNQIWKPVNWWRWSRHVHIKRMCQFGVAVFLSSSLTLSSFSISIEILGVFLLMRIKRALNKLKQILRSEIAAVSFIEHKLNKQNSMIDSLLLSFFSVIVAAVSFVSHIQCVCDASICHVMIFPLLFSIFIVLFHRRGSTLRLSLKNW